LPLNGRRNLPARRPLFASLLATFLLLNQVAFIFPAAASAQTRTTRVMTTQTSTSASDTIPAPSDSTAQSLPFTQNWSNTGLITANDNWSGVPGIEGFFLRNDASTTSGVDPQTLLGDTFAGGGAPELSVLANQTNTAITNGDVAEFHTTSQAAPDNANSTIALQGSGAADAPYLLLHLNTTGQSNINVAYNLRDIDCTADSAQQPVALQFRVGTTGTFTNVPAGFVADATTGPSICTAVTAVSATLPAAANNQSVVQVRIMTTNAAGNDEWVGVDDINVTSTNASGQPNLSINDVSQDEGNAGTTAFTFTVSLSSSTHGGVTFHIGTVDGTAQDGTTASEDTDYQANALADVTIPNGSQSAQFTVQVIGDTTTEPNETFFVNVVNVTGANVTDGQGQGTIVNDDITLTPIHTIQGSGTASPLSGQTVSSTGIVTLLKTGQNTGAGSTANGFFMQTPDAEADADPNTSQGIFVFTSTVPAVAVGDEVRVTGTVVEFNGLTELGTVTNISVIDTGNSLPTPVTIDATLLDPTAPPTKPQLEKFEGMRLAAASLRTVTPNDNFFDVETVLPSVPRQQVFREPGIPASDPIPPDPTSGTPDPNIPIWDENPERLKVDTNGSAGTANTPLTSNVTLSNVVGSLDFSFGEYRLIPRVPPTASANMAAVPVPTPTLNEFTVTGFNIENFNNNATQRQKAALTVRDVLHLPDIIGAVEIFDLADLQALADEIESISGVEYSAHLVEQDGTSEDNDQDVGYLVKTSRVSVTSATAERTGDTFINPTTGNPETTHDRPPFVLRATVNPSGANPQPVIVIVNHLRSFIDIELVAGEGPRVRAKRKAQAESLAGLLQELQSNNPSTPVISVGDYNAFQFNNGYDDPISVLKGTPTPDDQIVVDQSPDLVEPNFTNLIDELPADQKYSFIFEGTPQMLDHVLVNTVARSLYTRVAVARVNADFPEAPPAAFATNAARPERNSDHDPVVSYFALGAPQPQGSVIISEFRFRGPGLPEQVSPIEEGGDAVSALGGPVGPSAPGTASDNDEFVEIYNNTDSDITVSTTDGSAGWALVASDGVTRFTIPAGTVIPARGHFLGTNADGYSLSDYGCPDCAAGDATYTLDIPDGGGIALFRTSNSANFTEAERLDAAGYSTAPALYREGAGFPTGGGEMTGGLEYSFVRYMGQGAGGRPRDTGDNLADFIAVNTDGAATALGARLGAPGPENLFSPIQNNAQVPSTLLDQTVSASSPPNRVRDLTSDPTNNSQFGTLSFRRTFTNNTGRELPFLIFRIVDLTTFPAPNSATADLRALDSPTVTVQVNDPARCGGSPPCEVPVQGLFVEQPPLQPNGGGWNTSLLLLFDGTLANGATVNVNFTFGVQQRGNFRFFFNVEAPPDLGTVEGPLAPLGGAGNGRPTRPARH
jgi:predicted extracellular nuclease